MWGRQKGQEQPPDPHHGVPGGVAQTFEASSEVDPCTKGLHISTIPVPAEDKDGSSYSLLFLDTEGIDSTDQDRREMCQVQSYSHPVQGAGTPQAPPHHCRYLSYAYHARLRLPISAPSQCRCRLSPLL